MVVKAAVELLERYGAFPDVQDLAAEELYEVAPKVARAGSALGASIRAMAVAALAVATYEVVGFAYVPIDVGREEAEKVAAIMRALGYRAVQDGGEMQAVAALVSASWGDLEELAEEGGNYIAVGRRDVMVFEEDRDWLSPYA